jgi:hypothetical protein
LYRWVTDCVPETACCAVAGVGTGKPVLSLPLPKAGFVYTYEHDKDVILYGGLAGDFGGCFGCGFTGVLATRCFHLFAITNKTKYLTILGIHKSIKVKS